MSKKTIWNIIWDASEYTGIGLGRLGPFVFERKINRKGVKRDFNLEARLEHTRSNRDYQPKVFTLIKPFPGAEVGLKFQQSFPSDGEIYFCAIPIRSDTPEEQQVGIIEIEAKHVENNTEWFKVERLKESSDA